MTQIAPLTGLRGVAAYAVLIAHAMASSVGGKGIANSVAVGLAHFGMSLFFVLSGFVIAYNYENKLHLPHGRKRFFVARFARLFPLYAAVLLVYAWPLIGHANLIVIATHATMTQSWFNTEEAFFAATWSISTEWFFYFAFAYIITIGKLHKFVGLHALFAFSAIAIAILSAIFILKPQIETFLAGPLKPLFVHSSGSNTIWTWFTYYSPFVRIFEFVLGVIAARIYSTSKQDISAGAAFVAGAWCVLLIAFGEELLSNTFLGNFLPNFAFAPAIVIIMLYSSQDKKTIAFTCFSGAIMLWAGEISYSVYLLQAAGRNTALLFVQNPVMDVLLTCVFTTVIASASFIAFEKPARAFVRRLFDVDHPRPAI